MYTLFFCISSLVEDSTVDWLQLRTKVHCMYSMHSLWWWDLSLLVIVIAFTVMKCSGTLPNWAGNHSGVSYLDPLIQLKDPREVLERQFLIITRSLDWNLSPIRVIMVFMHLPRLLKVLQKNGEWHVHIYVTYDLYYIEMYKQLNPQYCLMLQQLAWSQVWYRWLW